MSVQWTNRFWSMSLNITLLLDFFKLFVKMCLTISFVGVQKSYLGPTDQKLWVFEGQACAGANDEELTICKTFWGQEGGGRGQGGNNNGGSWACGRQPAVASRRPRLDQ
jgi:hypothetical protein